MNKRESLDNFIKKNINKKIILFGAAGSGKMALLNLIQKGIKKKNLSFSDNNPEKWNKEIMGVKVISLDKLKKQPKNVCILISSTVYKEIILQLRKLGFKNFHYIQNLLLMNYLYLKYDDYFMQIMKKVGSLCLMGLDEKYTLYSSMKAVSQLQGDIAEVGVYKGGSAKILCELKANKKIYLFDTFEGLPGKVIKKEDLVKQNWLNDVILDEVKANLKKYPKVYFYKGIFPETSKPVKDKRFSLVHLDADIYQATLEGLKFFWPRMVKGGRIICHDYNQEDCPGVKRAVCKYFKNNPERIIEIADRQCMVIK